MLGFSSSLFILLLTVAEMGFGQNTAKFSRDDFPSHFVFGSGTSAYQVEGAAFDDGRTPSIWDNFTHAGNLDDKSNGDIACDQYHKYKFLIMKLLDDYIYSANDATWCNNVLSLYLLQEDVKLMVDTGLEAYRFSISWSRLIPNGRGPVNPKGLQYYNNLINELTIHGIQPHVTLFHYDLPQVLEDEYEGWLGRDIVKDFTAYADVCFREFGDRVLYWTTVNEANVFALGSYDSGIFPPKRCSSPYGANCASGNSTSEPYIVAHNILLAHASAARLYKKKYQAKQHGFIGLNLFIYWFIPLTNAKEDVLATQRAYDFYVGWFFDPLVFGDYPDTMKKNVGSRIPSFTPHQSEQVKGSFDFFGVNHYGTSYIKDNPNSLKIDQRDFNEDMAAKLVFKRNDLPVGEFPIIASGMQEVLEYVKQVYGNPPIYIHENGQMTLRNASLNDTSRVKYLEAYIGSLLNAVRNGSDTRGYFSWSFLDVFELLDGYKSSFGLYYIDMNDRDLKRYPKLSAQWYSNFLKGRSSISNVTIETKNNLSAPSQITHSSQ
ncbi:hypothetical protein HHK36_012408 [Tetracentron sinense]|uniref:Beta-glucosidase 11-like n=1 Tax=Tetracentron sinense TaxID=13715 RepID=A0A834Z4S2_TETSI|nr:hypothetical protein HHK36_012408 [Tetracentron sinense]